MTIGNDIINELLDEDEIPDNIDTRDKLLAEIDQMTNEVSEVKSEVAKCKDVGNPVFNGEVFNEMSDLTKRSTSILDACKDAIESCSIIDADLISAYASLIHSTKEIISEYIVIYRDRQKHLDKVELEHTKQEYKKELLIMKNNLSKSVDSTYEDSKVFVQEAVIDLLDERLKKQQFI